MTIRTVIQRLVPIRQFILLFALLALARPASASLGSLGLRAMPELVRADGHSTTTITAEVRTSGGGTVADGTEVHFTTTAGRIDDVVPTAAGRARATFTSDAIPGVAQVSAFSGASSATISVRMVEDPEALGPSGKVLNVRGKYVAYSESQGIVEAIGDARITWKGQLITAQMAQVDLVRSIIRARGAVQVESRDKKKQVTGDPFAVDMLGDQATLVAADAWQTLDFPTLAPLTPAPAAPDPREWADLKDSDMLWKAERIVAVPGQKLQLRRAEAFLGGQRVLRLPYHEISLAEGVSGQGQQYLGVGSNGLSVDLPYFLGMSPGASTSLRLRRGSRSGFGWYGTTPGWQLDLEQKYGIAGATEGTFGLGRITSGDWGLHWNHSQRLAKGTQAYALLEYPSHRDLFSSLNLASQGRIGNVGLNLSLHKLQDHAFGRTLDLNANTAPRSVGGTGVRLSLESRLYDSRGGDFVAFNGKRYVVAPSFSRELGLRLTPSLLKLGRGGISSWVSLKEVWGSRDRSGFGLAGALAFNHPIGKTGGMTLNYSYNRFPGITFYGAAGRQTLSGSLRLSPMRHLFVGAFGSFGLDSPTRSISASAAYSFGPLWRLQLQQTAYHFRTLQEQDLQLGLSRAIGPREITVYWSQLRHRVMFELAGGGF